MKTTIVLLALMSTLICYSCNKSKDSANKIDVSAQWQVDNSGQLIAGLADNQWQSVNFTTAELNLFASLDTASLAGTATPGAVLAGNLNRNSVTPNPFLSTFNLYLRFNNGYAGQLLLKSVVVDSLMNPLDKRAVRLQATVFGPENVSSSNNISISPNLPAGRYRVYFTLSSATNQHFYTMWGNIQKK